MLRKNKISLLPKNLFFLFGFILSTFSYHSAFACHESIRERCAEFLRKAHDKVYPSLPAAGFSDDETIRCDDIAGYSQTVGLATGATGSLAAISYAGYSTMGVGGAVAFPLGGAAFCCVIPIAGGAVGYLAGSAIGRSAQLCCGGIEAGYEECCILCHTNRQDPEMGEAPLQEKMECSDDENL